MSKRLDARDLRIALHELTYVPWPDGKTEADMLAEVRLRALDVAAVCDTTQRQSIHDHLAEPQEAIAKLKEAIKVYELGKPLAKKSERNESLVDRHMTP